MAKFILMFDDTIDKGIEASFDIVNLPEGAEDTAAIVLGRKLLEEITNAWSYKESVPDETEESATSKVSVETSIQGTVS